MELSDEMVEFKSTICPACNQQIDIRNYFQNTSDLVTISIAWNEMERISITALLKHAGIKVHLKQIPSRNLAGLGKPGSSYDSQSGPAEIQVIENDVDKASEIVHEYLGQIGKTETSDGSEEYDQLDVVFNEGTALLENGDYLQAEIKFLEALNLEPDSQDIFYNLTLVYLGQKKLETAWKFAKKTTYKERSQLIKEIKKIEGKLFQDFCPICTHFNENEGLCYQLKENITRYPKRFLKKCNGTLFKKDLTKYMRKQT
jgi:tetratricopeptide (TPR) repeat protein